MSETTTRVTEGRREYYGAVERLTRAELDALQLARLRAQLARVYATAPFYKRQFDDAGFDPDIGSLDEFFARAPFLVKSDLIADQEAEPPFGTRLAVDPRAVRRVEITSGTSGLGQEVYALTQADIATVGRMAAWTFGMRGVVPGDRVAIMLPLGYLQGPWGGHWGAEEMGAGLLHLGLAPDTASRLRYMSRFGVHALYTPTPTYLMRLSNVAREIGFDPPVDLPQFKTAWLAGEPYPLEWAVRMQEFWGARFCESYGSTQGGMAATCEHGVVHADGTRGFLHVLDWHVLIEVLDPETGAPVAPGDTGEAVLTTLTREATPIIRFRTGDRVRVMATGSCPCGRETTVLEAGTVGRLDDMLKIKGMNVWPAAVDAIVLGVTGVHDYFATVGLDERGYEYARVRVCFEPAVAPQGRTAMLEDLASRLRAATNVTMQVYEVEPHELPDFEYKARRWSDTRAAQLLAAVSEPGA